ncbi:protein phosphatase 1 regulatory subunit 14D isoform 1-T1 [Morphnus guianensis]
MRVVPGWLTLHCSWQLQLDILERIFPWWTMIPEQWYKVWRWEKMKNVYIRMCGCSRHHRGAGIHAFFLREETEAAAPEPQIDLEDLLEVPNEEQKLKLQEILHECASPTEDFITELLSRLKGLRRVTNPQKK